VTPRETGTIINAENKTAMKTEHNKLLLIPIGIAPNCNINV
jgi:hypothetical protein